MFASAAIALNNPQQHPPKNPQAATTHTSAPEAPTMNGIGSGGGETIYGGGNTRMLDPNNMPSQQASMARTKSQEVMEALRSGEPGAADKLMGPEHAKNTDGFLKRF